MPFSLSTVRFRLKNYFSKPGIENPLDDLAWALLDTADALETAQKEIKDLKLKVASIEKSRKAT